MENQTEFEIDVASYPEFENLVVEIKLGTKLTIVISREPGDKDFCAAFYGSGEPTEAPSYSKPSDENRVLLSDVLTAIEQGCEALKVPEEKVEGVS